LSIGYRVKSIIFNYSDDARDISASECDGPPSQRRSGPLSGQQQRQCDDKLDQMVEWLQLKAKEWNVSESTIAQALGLHNVERRKTSLWNKHQIQFYSNPRNPGGVYFTFIFAW
jgi:hypothetical protein